MYSGVGRLDSPKYSFKTPSIDIAISASSRMRECGTRKAEGATAGVMCLIFQDTVGVFLDLIEQLQLAFCPSRVSYRFKPFALVAHANEQQWTPSLFVQLDKGLYS